MYFTATTIAFFLLIVPTTVVIVQELSDTSDDVFDYLQFAFFGVFFAIVLALMWPATMTGIVFYYLIKYLDLRSQR